MPSLSLAEEESLSGQVERYKCLYDKTNSCYMDSEIVHNAWQAVADNLDFIEDGEHAQTAFTNLKKRYLKKRNELKIAKRCGKPADFIERAERAFKAYNFMCWIDDFVRVRRGKIDCPHDDDTTSEDLSEEQPTMLYVDSSVYEPSAVTEPTRSEDLFCQHLCAEMKRMSEYDSLIIQRDIQNLLFQRKMARLQNRALQNETKLALVRPPKPTMQPVTTNMTVPQEISSIAHMKSPLHIPLDPPCQETPNK